MMRSSSSRELSTLRRGLAVWGCTPPDTDAARCCSTPKRAAEVSTSTPLEEPLQGTATRPQRELRIQHGPRRDGSLGLGREFKEATRGAKAGLLLKSIEILRCSCPSACWPGLKGQVQEVPGPSGLDRSCLLSPVVWMFRFRNEAITEENASGHDAEHHRLASLGPRSLFLTKDSRLCTFFARCGCGRNGIWRCTRLWDFSFSKSMPFGLENSSRKPRTARNRAFSWTKPRSARNILLGRRHVFSTHSFRAPQVPRFLRARDGARLAQGPRATG